MHHPAAFSKIHQVGQDLVSRPVAAAAQKSESEVGKGAKGPRKQPWRPVVVPGTTGHGASSRHSGSSPPRGGSGNNIPTQGCSSPDFPAQGCSSNNISAPGCSRNDASALTLQQQYSVSGMSGSETPSWGCSGSDSPNLVILRL